MLHRLLLFLSLLIPLGSFANNSLQDALGTLRTLHAEFLQVDRMIHSSELKSAQGEIWVQTPGKFHWKLKGSEAQTIIADGELLWLYDIPLAQVSVYQQQEALVNSPAIILSNPDDISRHFEVTETGRNPVERSYALYPKKQNYLFAKIELIIREQKISELAMTKQDGSETRFSLFYKSYNQTIPKRLFQFTLPDNVDLIQ